MTEQTLQIDRKLLEIIFEGFLGYLNDAHYEWSADPELSDWEDAKKVARILEQDISDEFIAEFAGSKGWK